MFDRLFLRLFLSPSAIAKPSTYFANRLLFHAIGLTAVAVWLLVPLAIFQYAGVGWLALWLGPTLVAVFCSLRQVESQGAT